MAIAKLAALAGPVDRVVLAHAYDVGHWLPLGYQELCEREVCLSDEDGLKLGILDVLKIARLRVAMRSAEVKLDGPARALLVQDAFKSIKGPYPDEMPTSDEVQVVETPLIVPAVTLPSVSEDIVLSHVPTRLFADIKAAIATATEAQREAQYIRSVFEPLAISVRTEIGEAAQVPNGGSINGRASYLIAQNGIKMGTKQLSLYTEQIQMVDDKFTQTKEVVASLVSQASSSRSTS
jgi:hypothetical protein